MENLNKRTLTEQTKTVAFNVYLFFKKRKADFNSEEYKNDTNLIKLVADATGLSPSSITRIIREGKEIQRETTSGEVIFPEKPKEKHVRKKRISVDSETELLIRKEVIQYYEAHKQVPSIRKLNAIIKSQKILNCSNEYLRNLLNELGFTNTTETKKEMVETKDAVKARFNYLKSMKAFRHKDRNIFILNDMTFTKGSNKFVSPNIESIIVLHLSGFNSFSDGSTLIIKNTGSEIKTIKENHIENYRWVERFVKPFLPNDSVIVFNTPELKNRAACLDDQPNSTHTRGQIQEWLTKYNIPFSPTQTKEYLLNLIKAIQNEHEYSIETLFEMNGHEVLHMPPNHTKFNPVSLALKDRMAVAGVSVDSWTGYINQVKSNEMESYQEDLKFLAPYSTDMDTEFSMVQVKTEIEVDIDLNTTFDGQ